MLVGWVVFSETVVYMHDRRFPELGPKGDDNSDYSEF